MISLNDVLLAMSNIPVDDPIAAEMWGRQMQGGYKIIEYTGSLPIAINANGDVLLDYRIYGADGGVGVATDSGEPAGYKLPMTVSVNYEYVFTGSESFSNSYGRYQFSLPKAAIKKSNASNTSCSHFPYGTGFSNSGTFSFEIGKYAYFGVRNEYPTIPDFKQFLTDQYNAGTPMRLKYFLAPSDVPVYIGENQLDSVEGVSDYVDRSSGKIVKYIKEYTFTGDEQVDMYGLGFSFRQLAMNANAAREMITTRFSHFTARTNTVKVTLLYNHFGDNCACFRATTNDVLLRSTANFTTVEECKAYFKNQYDNGTPVKMWYIMNTPDEEEAPAPFPDIPTIKGETVIDYDGDPKPSQMYVKYKGEE